jgi:type VI secretion system secreted protein VgrG
MNKKSGTAGSPVSPADPNAAEEADQADPGEVEKIKAEQRKTQTGKYGTVQVKPYKPPGPSETEPEKEKKSWIEIKLVDEQNDPVPGEPYSITLPDGETVASGTLDEKGFARIDGIDPGTCNIAFPQRDKEAWAKA